MKMPQLMVGDPVDGRDGRLGTVAGTREATAEHDAAYVLVELSRLFGLRHTTRLVPAAWVRPAPPEARRVTLLANRADVLGCPPLRADADILADLAPALSTTATGLFRVATLRATVRNGVVDLTGHALSASDTHAAIAHASNVRGVLKVQNHAAEDGALILAVAQALTHDPDARRAHLRVGSRVGVVRLTGDLPSAAAGQRATALALAVPGVVGVHNEATVLPPPGTATAGDPGLAASTSGVPTAGSWSEWAR